MLSSFDNSFLLESEGEEKVEKEMVETLLSLSMNSIFHVVN